MLIFGSPVAGRSLTLWARKTWWMVRKAIKLGCRKNGSQAHEVHKQVLRKASGPKGAQKEK